MNYLKVQVEEMKRIDECLNEVVKNKTKECTRLEQEIVDLKIDLK